MVAEMALGCDDALLREVDCFKQMRVFDVAVLRPAVKALRNEDPAHKQILPLNERSTSCHGDKVPEE